MIYYRRILGKHFFRGLRFCSSTQLIQALEQPYGQRFLGFLKLCSKIYIQMNFGRDGSLLVVNCISLNSRCPPFLSNSALLVGRYLDSQFALIQRTQIGKILTAELLTSHCLEFAQINHLLSDPSMFCGKCNHVAV